MGFESTVGANIVVNGKNFPPLKRRQLGNLLAAWSSERRKRLMATLEDAKATPEQRLAELKDFDRRAHTATFALACMYEEFGRMEETIIESLKASDPNANEEAFDKLGLTRDEIEEASIKLWGFWVEPDRRLIAIQQAWGSLEEKDKAAAWDAVKNAKPKTEGKQNADPTTPDQTTS